MNYKIEGITTEFQKILDSHESDSFTVTHEFGYQIINELALTFNTNMPGVAHTNMPGVAHVMFRINSIDSDGVIASYQLFGQHENLGHMGIEASPLIRSICEAMDTGVKLFTVSLVYPAKLWTITGSDPNSMAMVCLVTNQQIGGEFAMYEHELTGDLIKIKSTMIYDKCPPDPMVGYDTIAAFVDNVTCLKFVHDRLIANAKLIVDQINKLTKDGEVVIPSLVDSLQAVFKKSCSDITLYGKDFMDGIFRDNSVINIDVGREEYNQMMAMAKLMDSQTALITNESTSWAQDLILVKFNAIA